MIEHLSSKLAPSNLDKHFLHKDREPELYKMWEEAKILRPESARDQKAPVFNIAMPPPNANGELHLGHAFGYTVMDILGRFHRMLGERVLLLPGKDHAGIQTQVVFEKKLKSEGVDVHAKDPKDLYKQCYDFCIDRADYMRKQEKSLGLSADWSRELFTLDPRLSDIVFETFERMWKDGLVYKGHRIVNWSVFSQTSISDVEVEYKEQDGSLWYVKYMLEGGKESISTATTRPETMLGDTALAVHPEDERYKQFIGKRAIIPIANRAIPIIADARVDPTFGTGVVKVTPAHDFNDYEIGVDHKLEMIQVIGKDGKMTADAGGGFVGMTTTAAREKIIQALEQSGQLLDTKKIRHKVPIGERGKDIIEPLISEQWFVNVDKPGKSLKGEALALLKSGAINIYPQRFQVLFEQWLENLRDWNISRQLWWGHRLPVWFKREGGKEEIYVGRKTPEGSGWEQEKDVFDTWYSSGQWAFSTTAASGLCNLESPRAKSDFFPTHTMVMGRDILFFWACRMLLLTVYRTGEVPWKNIFFTGLIQDEHGQKMSKSKGNGIDPNETILKYGADSLRLALVMGASPGNDLPFSERKIEGYNKFQNKLWNAAKLIEMKLGENSLAIDLERKKPLQLASSKWLLSELQGLHANVTSKLSEYEVSIAAAEAYNFSWFTFCDWYLEMMKVLVEKGGEAEKEEVRWTAAFAFRSLLTILHPFIPFLTEEIYQKLTPSKELLAASSWKVKFPELAVDNREIQTAMEIIGAVRSVKSALNISHKRIRISPTHTLSSEMALLVQELSKADIAEASTFPSELTLRKPVLDGVVVCEVEGKENYKKRLEKDVLMHRGVIQTLQTKLASDFAKHAKPEIVETERDRLRQSENAIVELERELTMLI